MHKKSSQNLDRSAFSIGSLSDGDEKVEMLYWKNKTAIERLETIEQIRQILYGYDPSSTRLQRILEVAELKPS
jgi:hypothetical protein